MTDPERIWLQNADDARATGDRLWCQDKVWPECAEQQDPTEYIRADLYASRISQQDAELERLRREVEATQKYAGEKSNQVAALIRDLADAEKKFETSDKLRVFWNDKATELSEFIRAKAEETLT